MLNENKLLFTQDSVSTCFFLHTYLVNFLLIILFEAVNARKKKTKITKIIAMPQNVYQKFKDKLSNFLIHIQENMFLRFYLYFGS